MKARRLAVLDINDRDVPSFRTGFGVARYFDVRRLRTWKAVQQDIGGTDTFRPDIVLADIDFEEDPSISSVEFQGCGEAKPIGPLLALPYVASRPVWTFALYSAHFKQDTSGVMESPWVLLPFGILFAKLESRVFDSRVLGHSSNNGNEDHNGSETVEDQMAKLLRVGNPAEALEEALDLHNIRLTAAIRSGKVRVTNGEQLRKQLRELVDACLAVGPAGRVNMDENVYLELFSPNHGVDRIQWISLCADMVNFEDLSVNADAAKTMLEYAEVLCGADPVFQMTVEVIRSQNQAEGEAVSKRPAFDWVASEMYGHCPEQVRHEILRLGVLFANVHTWALNGFTALVKKEIFSRLGISSEGNTYRGWFGARSRGTEVCQKTLRVPVLRPFSAQNSHSYYLTWGETDLSSEDKERILHYLETFEEAEGYPVHVGLSYLQP